MVRHEIHEKFASHATLKFSSQAIRNNNNLFATSSTKSYLPFEVHIDIWKEILYICCKCLVIIETEQHSSCTSFKALCTILHLVLKVS